MAKNKSTAEGSTSTPKNRGGRKPTTKYSISLAGQKQIIDQLADLYSMEPAAIVEGLSDLYVRHSFSAHLSRLQGEYSEQRRAEEEQVLAKIHEKVNGGEEEPGDEPVIEEVPV